MKVGQLRKGLSHLTDDGEIAVMAGDKVYVVTGTIVALKDNAIMLKCQEPNNKLRHGGENQ